MAEFKDYIPLFMDSPAHRNLPLYKLHRAMNTPLSLDFHHTVREGDKVVGLMTWGFFSPEVKLVYMDRTRVLYPSDWESGEERCLISVVAPYGNLLKMAKEIRKKDPEIFKCFHMRHRHRPGVFIENRKRIYSPIAKTYQFSYTAQERDQYV